MAQYKHVTVEGLDELIERFDNADSNVHRIGKAFLRDLSNFGVKQAQIEILNKGAVDTNELIQGMRYDLSDSPLESIIQPSDTAQKYAAAVDQGSKPHFPPIEALQGWADRHGIPVWAVARKIARDGTAPRFFWIATYEALDQHVQGELAEFAKELARWL
jgi:hypothetical protein